MPRLLGVSIPDNKNIEIALTYIHGIGRPLSKKILESSAVKPSVKASALSSTELNRIKELIEKNYKTEGELRRQVMINIRRLKDIGTWRGMRHMKKLPVRGQRTKTNTRTVRGNVRKTVGSGRKPPTSPT